MPEDLCYPAVSKIKELLDSSIVRKHLGVPSDRPEFKGCNNEVNARFHRRHDETPVQGTYVSGAYCGQRFCLHLPSALRYRPRRARGRRSHLQREIVSLAAEKAGCNSPCPQRLDLQLEVERSVAQSPDLVRLEGLPQ